MNFSCELKEETTRPVLSIRFRAPVADLPGHFNRVYGKIMKYLEELGEQHAGPAAFAVYHNMDMANLDIEAGFPVHKSLPGRGDIESKEIPGGMFAICHYRGPYEDMPPAYEQLKQFAESQGYRPMGVVYEWYLNGPDIPPDDLQTDIAFPVIFVGEAQPL